MSQENVETIRGLFRGSKNATWKPTWQWAIPRS